MLSEKVAIVDDKKISYFESGRGETSLIFLHGFGDRPDGVRERAAFFANSGYKVIVPYVLGFGKSHVPFDYFFPTLVEEMGDFFRQVGTNKSVLIGESLGGGLAYALAAENRQMVTHLVLDCPLLTPMEKSLQKTAAQFLWGGAKDLLMGKLAGEKINAAKIPRVNLQWTDFRLLPEMWKLTESVDLKKYPALSIPILVLLGKDDRAVEWEKQKKAISGSWPVTVAEFPGSHSWYLRYEKTRLQMIKDFVENGKLTGDYPPAKITYLHCSSDSSMLRR